MKEITVENFSCSNLKEWIADYSHKEKVEFAVYCAELVIGLYTGTSDAPKKAIQSAKDWILNPSKENKRKCKNAYASAAAAAAYAAAAAADSAAYAAYAATADSASAATADSASAAASAAAADSASAAYAAADAKRSIKDKIISYINNKQIPKTKEVEWENGLPTVGEECEYFHGPREVWVKFIPLLITSEESSPNGTAAIYGETLHPTDFIWEPDLIELSRNPKFRKPETPEAKKEREELEAAYDLYCHVANMTSRVAYCFEQFCDESLTDYKNDYLEIVRKTGYRVEN